MSSMRARGVAVAAEALASGRENAAHRVLATTAHRGALAPAGPIGLGTASQAGSLEHRGSVTK